MDQKLKNRVEKAKKELKQLKVKKAKTVFFDEYYGKMYHSENVKLLNLWQNKLSTDQNFTENLEKFTSVQIKIAKKDAELRLKEIQKL